MNGTGSLRSHPSPTASAPPVTIDKGVPIPKRRSGRVGRPYSATGIALRAMGVGESFVWPRRKSDTRIETTRSRASEAIQRCKPKKFRTRIVEEDGQRVIRVWRVA